GLYFIHFAVPAVSGACTAPYILNSALATPDCEIQLFPDPFYSEAIPASPLIPPLNNNGGYLWNTWGFNFGTVTTVANTTGPGATTAGGYVPGESTGTTAVRGGQNVTALTECAPGVATETLTVQNGAGFLPGMTLEAYNIQTGTPNQGKTELTGILITAVSGNVLTLDCTSVNQAFANSPFNTNGGTGFTTVPSASADFISEQFGLPVANASTFTANQDVTVISGNKTFSSIVATDQTGAALIDTTNNIVYVNGAEGLATAFGCTSGLSRPVGTTNCEPSSLVPPGTTLSVGTSTGAGTNGGAPPFGAPTGSSASGTGPYPFWQWVPGAQGAGSRPSNATVYSDNHGEAVVALQTNVSTQVAPTNGVCPSGYTPVTSGTGGAVINCLLPFTALATSGAPGNGPFANIASAISQFSASKPGCLNTFSTGTTSVATTATIGANGPSAGQICINNLGGIEFGSQATLGQTTIQAVADYPYTRGEHAPVGSAPLTKVFTSGFSKSVTVSAGTAGPVGTTAYIVTVTALDLCGTPLNGEPIQVYALGNAGAAVLAPVSYGTLISAGTTSAVVTPNVTSGTATFSLEVLNTAIGNQGLIVKVVFPLESVERFATVISGTVTGVTTTVVYPPGWQQVGGPSGSNFSVAEALFSWDPTASAYTNASAAAGNISSAPPACTGYWAYFAAAMSISFTVTSHPGDVATCTLKSGWNLVGNPFGSAATIQSGVTAFHWNGTSYDTVGVIGVGQSVWIFNSGTLNTVTLTAT
nr:hypothetical protein [Actinomycetota bacterium]